MYVQCASNAIGLVSGQLVNCKTNQGLGSILIY